MKKRNISNINRKYLSITWLLTVILACIYLIFRLLNGSVIETNIMALLPAVEFDPAVNIALQKLETTLGKKTIFIVGTDKSEKSIEAAKLLHNHLEKSNLFAEFTLKIEQSDQREFFEFYFPYRSVLISNQVAGSIRNSDFKYVRKMVYDSLFNPLGTAFPDLMKNDPLFLFMDYLKQLPKNESELVIKDGYLTTEKEGIQYVFFIGVLNQKPMSISVQEDFDQTYNLALKDIKSKYKSVIVRSSGMIHHAIYSMKSMKRDITLISVGSLLGILVLIVLTFKSIKPLFICVIPIIVGFLMAFAVSLLFFGKVHLLTLVFGASLIGISIDYSFHYLSEQYNGGENWNSRQGLKIIFPGITLGLITSVIGFAALSIAPFPGLQQMSLFSVVGISSAYFVVVLIFPRMLKAQNRKQSGLIKRIASGIISFWDTKFSIKGVIFLFFICFLFVGWGGFKARFVDDIRLLQSRSGELLKEEAELKNIIGLKQSLPVFLVKGKTPQALLEKEELLAAELESKVKSGYLTGYMAFTSFVASINKQKQNYKLLKDSLQKNKELYLLLSEIGYKDDVIKVYRDLFLKDAPDFLTIEKWNRSAFSSHLQNLWLGRIDQNYVSMVSLGIISKGADLKGIADRIDGVLYLDHVTEISNLMRRYRQLSGKLVVFAYLIIFGLLLFRYGFHLSCLIISPPLFATFAAIAVVSVIGESLNLFNTIALFLVLGIGIDYTLFFAEKPENRKTTMMAIILSGFTTLLSFGLLTLSQIAFIHSFGVLIMVGIGTVFLTAPIVGARLNRQL